MENNNLTNEVKYKIVATVLFIIAVLVLIFCCHDKYTTVNFFSTMQTNTIVAAPELSKSTVYQQSIPCEFEKIRAIGFCFANYSNRSNSGSIVIQITSNEQEIGRARFEASQIADGEYQYVSLQESPSVSDELVATISSNSEPGAAVTIWSGINNYLNDQGATLYINDIQQPTQLNYELSLNERNPQLSKHFIPLLCLCFFMFFLTGVPQNLYTRLKNSTKSRKFILYLGIFLCGIIILCIRNLEFISVPVIYGEDGLFLTRQLEQGLLQGLFSTRGGDSADFSQTSAYILTFLSAKTTALLHGYSLAEYPFWMGIYGNASFAFAAVMLYRAFELSINRKIALIAYIAVIGMNLGNTSSEVLGRILNTGFLWVVIVAAALLSRFSRHNEMNVESILDDFLCFMGAFTFPICFLEIAIFLMFDLIRNRSRKTYFLIGNVILLITLAAGIILLPRLLTSKGAGAELAIKAESIIEFVFARHILFPFVWPFHQMLSDGVVITLFLIYVSIICWAGFIAIKKAESIINPYIFLAVLTAAVCGSSAYMRRTMTALFDNYTSTYPDRYYYGCNILTFTLGISAIVIIISSLWKNIDKTKKNVNAVCVIAIASIFCDPYIVNYTYGNYVPVIAGEYKGSLVDSCRNALADPKQGQTPNNLVVDIYPDGWTTELPLQYVLATARDNNIR